MVVVGHLFVVYPFPQVESSQVAFNFDDCWQQFQDYFAKKKLIHVMSNEREGSPLWAQSLAAFIKQHLPSAWPLKLGSVISLYDSKGFSFDTQSFRHFQLQNILCILVTWASSPADIICWIKIYAFVVWRWGGSPRSTGKFQFKTPF